MAILSALYFSRYGMKIISREHNWTADRDQFFTLLSTKGHTLKHRDLTDCYD
jgi:hypothetical protein